MRDWLTFGSQLALLTVLSSVVHGQSEHPLTAPDSIILSGWEYGDHLFVSTPAGNFPVQGPPGFKDSGYFTLPALAPGGDRIAAVLTLPDYSDRTKCDPTLVTCALPGPIQHKSVMGVYFIRDKSWKLYGDFCPYDRAGPAAFSPDGTKIAFKATIRTDQTSCDSGYAKHALLFLDLASGQFTQIPNTAEVMASTQISWSPDGKFIAVQIRKSDCRNENPLIDSIVLIEVGSWVQKQIAEGWSPSWSPKGEWIAYLAENQQKCVLIRPDGTGAKVVRDVSRRGLLVDWAIQPGEVWSPDGTALILTEGTFFGNYDEIKVDVVTGKVKKLPKDTPTIFGWVTQPHSATASVGGKPHVVSTH
jgi:hypothetical protein